MSAAASGLVEAMQIAHPGTEWDQITTGSGSWFVYGGGGIGGTGSLCGVPNGVCLVLNMCGQHGHAAKVMDYYNWTEFPTVNVELAYDADEWIAPVPIPSDFLTMTVAEIPLCHVSISKYCAANGVTLKDEDEESRIYKNDRCSKIACDVAAFALELMQGVTYTVHGPSNATATCVTCHNTGATSVIPAQQGNMECGYCHGSDAVIVSNKHGTGKGKW
jgi:hypothetical protein